MAQKEANYKLLEEMTELKKQMEDMKKPSTIKQMEEQRKQNSYETKKPIAFTIGESMLTKKFNNFNPVNNKDEEKSWEMIWSDNYNNTQKCNYKIWNKLISRQNCYFSIILLFNFLYFSHFDLIN